MIDKLLKNKTSHEKANLKALEISRVKFSRTYNTKSLRIEIVKVEKIEKGIQVFARAWNKNGQLGFGKDGSVDIERFRIFNPPVLVDDPQGTIIRKGGVDIDGNKQPDRKLRYDPQEAILQTLEHTIGLVGKENTKITKGKVGNTTSTFYPDADPESTSVDGNVERNVGTGESWNTLRTSAGTGANDSVAVSSAWLIRGDTTSSWLILRRGIFLFDTSALPDTDTIDSATMSLYGQLKGDTASITPDMNIYASTPASNTALVSGDYLQTGSTAFSTAITYANQTVGAYNDFSLNASGLSDIDKTGVSKFATRNANYDVANSAPTNASLTTSQFDVYNADQTGTANDPKLVVVHSASASSTDNATFFGCNF